MDVKSALAAVAATLTFAAYAAPYVAEVAVRPVGANEVLVRSGTWNGTGGGATGRWRARVERDPVSGALRGQITVDGSRAISSARLDGRMKGASLRATLKDADGRSLARLEGKVRGESIAGTFSTSAGERGTWRTQ